MKSDPRTWCLTLNDLDGACPGFECICTGFGIKGLRRTSDRRSSMQNLKEFCKQFVLWTPVAVHLTTEYVRLDRVSGYSMQPTLNPDSGAGNDIVLVDLLCRAYHLYQPGDVVVIR